MKGSKELVQVDKDQNLNPGEPPHALENAFPNHNASSYLHNRADTGTNRVEQVTNSGKCGKVFGKIPVGFT